MIPGRVSIVIPVYNCEKYVSAAIESCLSQTYAQNEVIVVDDGSTDNSPAVISRYSERVRTITQPNGGPGAALNKGMMSSTGEFLCFIGADDVLNPDSVEKRVRFLESHPDVDLVMGDWVEIDENGCILRSVSVANFDTSTATRAVFEQNPVNSATLLIRRRCFERAGWWNGQMRADNDGDLLLRFLVAGLRPYWMNETLVHYRVHEENITHNRPLMIYSVDRCRCRHLLRIQTKSLATGREPDGQLASVSRVLFKQMLFNSARLVLSRSHQFFGWHLKSLAAVMSLYPIQRFTVREIQKYLRMIKPYFQRVMPGAYEPAIKQGPFVKKDIRQLR